MLRRLKILAGVLVFVLVFAFLSGCGGEEAEPEPDGEEEPAETEESNKLRIATPYSIDTLDPTKYSSDGDYYVLSQVYEPLVNTLADGTVIYRLAESYTNPDDNTWVFELRDNMYWHDGNEVYPEGTKEAVTAEDVKYTFDFVMNSDNEARLQSKLSDIISKVEVLGDHKIKFVTQEPYAFFPQDLERVPIISEDVIDEFGRDELGEHPIGCGPYKFVEHQVDDRVVLKANDNFYIEPNVDEIVFRIAPDKSVGLMALESGDVDIALQIPASEVERVMEEDAGVKVKRNPYGWYRYAAFNCDHEFFEDVRVRKAIAYATDREKAVRTVFPQEQLADVAYGPVPKGILGFSDDWDELWEYDVDKAKELLAEAGWEDTDDDGIREKDGEELSFAIKAPNDPNRQKMATLFVTQWKSVGIEAEVVTNDWATHLDEIKSGDTEMFVMGGGSTADGLLYLFHSSDAAGGGHDTRYKNEELDAILEEAKATVDPQEREDLWREAAEITINERVHIPGYLEYVQIGIREGVEDFDPPTPWVSLVNEYRHVTIEK